MYGYLTGFHKSEARLEASRKIAQHFGASEFIIFIPDPQLDILLPGQGFPQTLNHGEDWQPFLKICLREYHSDFLFFENNEVKTPVCGIPCGEDSVAVLIGGRPAESVLTELVPLLPLLGALLKKEQEVLFSESHAGIAVKAAYKSNLLASTLDSARQALHRSLMREEGGRKDVLELMNRKDEFMDMASHELKTPMTTMKLYIQLIEEKLNGTADKTLLKFIHKAEYQVDKLVTLVNDLLDIRKIQNGKLVFNFSWFSLSELFESAADLVASSKGSHRLNILNKNDKQIYGDRLRLEQVLINFITNAIKYSPGKENIVLELSGDDHHMKLQVTDSGIGIPAEELPFVFERFFRVNEVVREFQGMGLGLYISAEIIRQHGGTIGAESQVNIGSAFWFTLPLEPAASSGS